MNDAIRRKLDQEMGIDVETEFSHKFIYRTNLDKQLIEYEYDHVYIGRYDGKPNINQDEVEDWKFEEPDKLKAEVKKHPERFTYWFRLILDHPELKTARLV
jgi:isopentenyl-diphosphate delta-isomerase